jgi:release factor glutamine methyltransferase
MQSNVSGLELTQWRNTAIKSAKANNIDVYEVDWLLEEIAGLSRLSLRLESFNLQAQIQLKLPLEDLEVLWQRRIHDRLPVQYITGVTTWRQFQIQVSPAVLIPRPETEMLIDLAFSATIGDIDLRCGHWADLGTGSGAIALGIADIFPNSTVHAVDFSPQALAMAQQNAQNSGLSGQIKFYQGSWWQPLSSLKGQFSGMISNPPYIPTATVATLEPEVADHEPHLALDGGNDGLDCIRHLIDISPQYLQPGGMWLIEMMAGQAEIVRDLIAQNGNYCNIEIHQDLAGIERFVSAQRLGTSIDFRTL